jgi:NAD(P)-dependent dehydrogenase (short-subunit alcohol dehydrogenase family)
MTDAIDVPPPRPAEPFRLDGRVAVVTGAARGIGFATARRLLGSGAGVCMVDIDGEALEGAATELGPVGPPTITQVADVADLSTHVSLVDRVVDELGSIDVLVNNAGTYAPTPLDSLDESVADRLYDVNVKSVLFLSSVAAARMRPGSVIINVSSLGGIRPPFTGLAAYHATKGAVDSLTRDMAMQWGPQGIRVNGAAPGGILTEGQTQVTESPLFTAEVLAPLTERAMSRPLGRMGCADDVAMVIAFLASPAAGFITGQQILVDGGYYYA